MNFAFIVIETQLNSRVKILSIVRNILPHHLEVIPISLSSTVIGTEFQWNYRTGWNLRHSNVKRLVSISFHYVVLITTGNHQNNTSSR